MGSDSGCAPNLLHDLKQVSQFLCLIFLICNGMYLIWDCSTLIQVEHLEYWLVSGKYSRKLSCLFYFTELVLEHTYNSHKSAWCIIFNWPLFFLSFKMLLVTALNASCINKWTVRERLPPVKPGRWAWFFKEFFLWAVSSLTFLFHKIFLAF